MNLNKLKVGHLVCAAAILLQNQFKANNNKQILTYPRSKEKMNCIKKSEYILSTKQEEVLRTAITAPLEIQDRFGNTRCAGITPWRIIEVLLDQLCAKNITAVDLNLEGSGAAHTLNAKSVPSYNDLDFVFHLNSTDRALLCEIRGALADTLRLLLTESSVTDSPPTRWHDKNEYEILELFIEKQFMTLNGQHDSEDSWALYSLKGSKNSPSIDLKFVQRISRPYQFSIDSFQIKLKADLIDQVINNAVEEKGGLVDEEQQRGQPPIGIPFGTSYPETDAAITHLKKKHIAVQNAEELAKVRGGGLLKFAFLLSRGWNISPDIDRSRLMKYMCTRFMMDYPYFQVSRFGTPANTQRIIDFVDTHLPPPVTLRVKNKFLRFLEKTVTEANVPDCIVLLQAIANAQYMLSIMANQANPSANHGLRRSRTEPALAKRGLGGTSKPHKNSRGTKNPPSTTDEPTTVLRVPLKPVLDENVTTSTDQQLAKSPTKSVRSGSSRSLLGQQQQQSNNSNKTIDINNNNNNELAVISVHTAAINRDNDDLRETLQRSPSKKSKTEVSRTKSPIRRRRTYAAAIGCSNSLHAR